MKKGQDMIWQDSLGGAKLHDCVDVESMDPMYILYTSGTTGKNDKVKAVWNSHGTFIFPIELSFGILLFIQFDSWKITFMLRFLMS